MTPQEYAHAASEGWTICDVYHDTSASWRVQILPTAFGPSCPNANDAAAYVVAQARTGAAVAIKALQAVMASHQQRNKGKK
jgi:hypothetical protein